MEQEYSLSAGSRCLSLCPTASIFFGIELGLGGARQEQEGHSLALQGNTAPLTNQVTGHLCRQKGAWGHHMSVF